MSADTIKFPVGQQPQTPGPTINKLLIDLAELAQLVSLSLRTLRRMDADRHIPGRVVVGRRVLFQTELLRDWIRAGLPDRETWAAIHKHSGSR